MTKILATTKGSKAIALFIAELNGYKTGTKEGKIAYGYQCWIDSKFHNPDISTEEGRKDFHEDVWLDRLYKELDAFYLVDTTLFINKKRAIALESGIYNTEHQWTTPIELDAGASMLQMMGVLLSSKELMTMTNMIGDELQDPWACEGMPRKMFKEASTPMLYGSSKACHELWQDNGHTYTIEQVKLYNDKLMTGGLAQANQLKEFIINYCKPTATVTVNIDEQVFSIECNRFKNVGDITTRYDIYDSVDNVINQVFHTHTHKEVDLEQFKRYFVTLLIHSLDSKVADIVIGKCMDKYGWGIDIHDAFIVNPESAEDIRAWYAEEMEAIWNRREKILSNYFNSIGVSAEANEAWQRLTKLVTPVTEFKCNPLALK